MPIRTRYIDEQKLCTFSKITSHRNQFLFLFVKHSANAFPNKNIPNTPTHRLVKKFWDTEVSGRNKFSSSEKTVEFKAVPISSCASFETTGRGCKNYIFQLVSLFGVKLKLLPHGKNTGWDLFKDDIIVVCRKLHSSKFIICTINLLLPRWSNQGENMVGVCRSSQHNLLQRKTFNGLAYVKR